MTKHWKHRKLQEVAQVVTGGTPATGIASFFGGEIPFVTPADLDSGVPIISTATSLTAEGAKQVRLLPQNAVLVSCIGTLGKTGIAGRPLATNQQINALIFDESLIFPRFGLYSVRLLKKTLERIAPSTTLKIVNKSRFSDLSILVPPLAEQHRIAAILDQAEALQIKRRVALIGLEKLTASIFGQMFGNLLDSRGATRLDAIVEPGDSICYGVVQPGSDAPDGVPMVRAGDFKFGGIAMTGIKKIDPGIEGAYRRSRLRGFEVLISCVGSIGEVALIGSECLGFNIARAVARIPYDRRKIRGRFLLEYLRTTRMQQYFSAEVRTVAQPTLNIKQLSEATLNIPSLEKQDHFVTLAQAAQEKLSVLEMSANVLECLVASLQVQAFEGGL